MGENPAALRAAVFSLSSKNLRGGRSNAPPPAGRGLKVAINGRVVCSMLLFEEGSGFPKGPGDSFGEKSGVS